MTYTLEFVRRMGRLRAPLFAALILFLTACDATESLNPDTGTLPDEGVEVVDVDAVDGLDVDETGDPDAASLAAPTFAAVRYAGGISFGTSNQPTEAFGVPFNGALRNIYPQYLLRHLAAIKARGGKVVLTLSGNPKTFTDAKGHFSLAKWKARVDRFKNTNINSYINDGTIVAHYLMDEPHNTHRWNGRPVPQSTVEEMARYSKARWPGMATVVRAYPNWLVKYRGTYRHLDAAWAQYVYRFGDAGSFIRKEISYAQKKGLALIVGLNVMKGGPNKRPMTASQVKASGGALLSSSYPCAFISWHYSSRYLSSSGIKDAMRTLRNKAQNRSSKSCRS